MSVIVTSAGGATGSAANQMTSSSKDASHPPADARSFSTATDDSSVYSDMNDASRWSPTTGGNDVTVDDADIRSSTADDDRQLRRNRRPETERTSTTPNVRRLSSSSSFEQIGGCTEAEMNKQDGNGRFGGNGTVVDADDDVIEYEDDVVASTEESTGKTAAPGAAAKTCYGVTSSSPATSDGGGGSGIELLGKLFPAASTDELERTLRRCSGNVVQSIEQLLHLLGGGGKLRGAANGRMETDSFSTRPHHAHQQTVSNQQHQQQHRNSNGSATQNRFSQHHQPAATSSTSPLDVPSSATTFPYQFHHQSGAAAAAYFRPTPPSSAGSPFPLLSPGVVPGSLGLPAGAGGGTAAVQAAVDAMRHAVFAGYAHQQQQQHHPTTPAGVGMIHPCLGPPSLPPAVAPTSSSRSPPGSSHHHAGRIGLPSSTSAGPSIPMGVGGGGVTYGGCVPYSPAAAAAAAAFLQPSFAAGLRYNYGAVMAAAAMFHASAIAAAAASAGSTNGPTPAVGGSSNEATTAASGHRAGVVDRVSPVQLGKSPAAVAQQLMLQQQQQQQAFGGASMFAGSPATAYGKSAGACSATAAAASGVDLHVGVGSAAAVVSSEKL